ncbi:monooxygenase [Ectothiorhodospira lacustris]|uniref:monooxygenase n=1 Tax=Ectothiorhodospira lacustris TaxID=2899127 RepID=UPI001EE7B156|nr:monooxygenase [Ectothiorhodospira lacustris]MCG5509618.1 monooxygenase [Ectothiorhodospira lacustris]MCG5521587.1 monooxygenase [Ectothiorhodospira lacustris]
MSQALQSLRDGIQAAEPHPLTTPELARAIGMKPDSIRVRLCRTGSFYGLRPGKLPNGRLIWPADSVVRLLAQSKAAA